MHLLTRRCINGHPFDIIAYDDKKETHEDALQALERERRSHSLPLACLFCGTGGIISEDSATPFDDPQDFLPFMRKRVSELYEENVDNLVGSVLANALGLPPPRHLPPPRV